jgi:catechol 2,3-dioxygenase-like lactoylglutathione lyase family enzyme
MASVKGIGGVFIESNQAEKLAEWYQAVLGIEMKAHPDGIGYYKVFLTRDIGTSVIRENPVFAINHSQEELPASGRGFTLNLRVDDLDQFLEELREKDISIEEKILVWERGKHAWIQDLDGNRVELYEEILLS